MHTYIRTHTKQIHTQNLHYACVRTRAQDLKMESHRYVRSTKTMTFLTMGQPRNLEQGI